MGFMPQGEVAGLVRNELGESLDLDRIKKLWLPRVQKANLLRESDQFILDDSRMESTVRPIDSVHAAACGEVERVLRDNPFWRANKCTLAMVRLDDLIILQNSVNLDRAEQLAKGITSGAAFERILECSTGLNRKPAHVSQRWIANNTVLFTTASHDVRPGNPEVRTVPRHENGSGEQVRALVIPIMEGEPAMYCVRTFTQAQFPDGTVQRVWFLTLQNGVHRAYALRSLGFEYVPMLVIDPETADETGLLLNNWTQERQQQGTSARPPLLRDFFDPDLVEVFEVPKSKLCIRMQLTVEKFTA